MDSKKMLRFMGSRRLTALLPCVLAAACGNPVPVSVGAGGDTPGDGSIRPSLGGSSNPAIDFGSSADPGGPVDPNCPQGGRTTISGTVYAPSGELPLYNVMVYVPSSPLTPLTEGAICSCEVSGDPVSAAITDEHGQFTLYNVPQVPAGKTVPLVIQVGKWRRLFAVPNVTACEDTAIPAKTLTLPAKRAEGDMPRIALSTGGADAMECLIRKLGVDQSEFTTPDGDGRINYYFGLEGTNHYNDAYGDGQFPDAQDLWSTVDSLKRYDVVLLSCEGERDYDKNKPDAAFKAMFDYANLGGRIFASHWHEIWLQRGPDPFPSVASFVSEGDLGTVAASVVTTFPKGKALSDWLVNVQGSTSPGKVNLTGTQHTVTMENSSYAQRWIATDAPATVQYMSANTPFGAAADKQCGRIVLSDIHVTGSKTEGRDISDPSIGFPDGCTTTDLTPQEKVLAYMLFDISACIVPDDVPPSAPNIVVR